MIKRIFSLLLAACLTLSLAACSPAGEGDPAVPPDYPVEVGGAKILERPAAVATLSPSMTRTLEELGLGGRITGISDYCDPPRLDGDYRYGRCGTAQSLSLSGIRRAAPKVVFSPAALTNDQLTQLQQMDVDVVVLPPAQNLEELRQNYTDLFRVMWGETTGRQMAEEYLRGFDARLEDIRSRAAQGSGALEEPYQGVYLTAGLLTMATGDTLEQELLTALGLTNAASSYTDYIYPQELETELDPDVIFFNGLLSREEITGSTCYKSTKAVQAGRVYQAEAGPFERQSPDLLLTLWKMGAQLYPEAFVATPSPSYDTSAADDGGEPAEPDDDAGTEDAPGDAETSEAA